VEGTRVKHGREDTYVFLVENLKSREGSKRFAVRVRGKLKWFLNETSVFIKS
jgi:hypothetical protein